MYFRSYTKIKILQSCGEILFLLYKNATIHVPLQISGTSKEAIEKIIKNSDTCQLGV